MCCLRYHLLRALTDTPTTRKKVEMKRAIVANADGRFISALVPKASAPSIYTGTRVRVLKELHLEPHAVIAAGVEGTVTFVDLEQGYIEVTLDHVVEGLYHWRNCLLLTPFETDDLLEGLQWTDISVASTCGGSAA
jgi:hypothetical protein